MRISGIGLSLAALTLSSAHGIVILVSDLEQSSAIDDFLNNNFNNVAEIRNGDFASFNAAATQDALNGTGAFAGGGAADLVIIGRNLSSGGYSGGNADGYNTLNIPVVSFTSYISRNAGNRLGWHTGSASNNLSTTGAETVITTAGTSLLGSTGPADWHESLGETFNGLGNSLAVGGGDVLATVGGQLLAAYWETGDAPGAPNEAGVANFPGPRLLFNLDDDGAERSTFNSLTAEGEAALIAALNVTTPLTAVPEPSSALLGLLALPLAFRRRRG